jgi:hypothetical protein
MRTTITFLSLLIISAALLFTSTTPQAGSTGKAGCDAYLYISNNSLFEVELTVDGIGVGHLLVGKNKTYNVELLNDTPKKIKVKIAYQDPDYIEPKTFFMVTKEKIECGQTDSMYISFTK